MIDWSVYNVCMRRLFIALRGLFILLGSDKRKIEKATSLNADCICLDMEDGVSATAKVLS